MKHFAQRREQVKVQLIGFDPADQRPRGSLSRRSLEMLDEFVRRFRQISRFFGEILQGGRTLFQFAVHFKEDVSPEILELGFERINFPVTNFIA